MKFNITILGCNAALPDKYGITSAQVVQVHNRLYMIDCGEGSQVKLNENHIRRNKITAILISHLHGDHLFGLPGLLTSYAHFQRKDTITIIGPVGIDEFVKTILRLSHAYVDFEIRIIELDHTGKQTVYEDDKIEVESFPLKHRVPTFGYIIREKKKFNNIKVDKIKELGLTIEDIKRVKEGKDLIGKTGEVIPNETLVFQKNAARKYAYCSDTVYNELIVPYIDGVDVLYHEATYLSNMKKQAGERMHSTVSEAAMIASKAKVGKLVIGHFSVRYGDKSEFLNEGQAIFSDITLASEGLKIEIEEKYL